MTVGGTGSSHIKNYTFEQLEVKAKAAESVLKKDIKVSSTGVVIFGDYRRHLRAPLRVLGYIKLPFYTAKAQVYKKLAAFCEDTDSRKVRNFRKAIVREIGSEGDGRKLRPTITGKQETSAVMAKSGYGTIKDSYPAYTDNKGDLDVAIKYMRAYRKESFRRTLGLKPKDQFSFKEPVVKKPEQTTVEQSSGKPVEEAAKPSEKPVGEAAKPSEKPSEPLFGEGLTHDNRA